MWQRTKIGDLVDIRRGASPRPIHQYISKSGMPWVKIADATADASRYVSQTNEYIKDEGIKHSVVVNPEDLIISNSATPGLPKIMKIKACIHDGWLVFSNYRGITRDYLYYTFVNIRSHLVNQANGSVFQNLKTDIVKDFEIDVPPLNVQAKIVEVLKKIDEMIEVNVAINNNLLHQLSLVFNEIYVVGKDAALGELLDVVESGSRPRGGAETTGIPSIGAENIERFGIYDFSKDKFISEQYFASLTRGKVHSGDVLLYKDGAYTGKVSMALDNFPHRVCAVNEHVFILRTQNNSLQFSLYTLVARDDIRQKIYTLASSKAAQPGLNQNELRSISILMPTVSELTQFEEFASPMMHKIAMNANENKRLASLRDTLLPKLMRGEIDVSDVKI